MSKRSIRYLVEAVILAGLWMALGLAMNSALAAPSAQEGAPQLQIVKSSDGDGTIAPGQAVRFHIAVTNTGEVTATSVVVQDDYDEVALPTIEAGASGAQNDGHMITWQVGDLEPGASWSASYDATAAQVFRSGTVTVSNGASVYADGALVAQARVELVLMVPLLTLSRQRVRLDDEGDMVPGAVVRHTIRYGNNGTADATSVVIEELYDNSVVQTVVGVSAGGQQDGSRVRWNLGVVGAGASGEVSYEVMLKPALAQGDNFEVRNQATLQADGLERLSVVDSFTLYTPLLTIERIREDLNGGAIEPGDTLLVTIRVRNTGQAEALGVIVQDDYYEQVVAEVSEISSGGKEAEGMVEWVLTEPLGSNTEQVFSYQVRLIGEIGRSTTVMSTAAVYISNVEVDRAQTSMTIEPAQDGETTTTTTEQPQIFEQKPETLAWLVGAIAGFALIAVVGTTLAGPVLMKDKWNSEYLRLTIEGVLVVVLVGAVLILAMGSGIKQDGAVSILSTIAGYVLGRTMTRLSGNKNDQA